MTSGSVSGYKHCKTRKPFLARSVFLSLFQTKQSEIKPTQKARLVSRQRRWHSKSDIIIFMFFYPVLSDAPFWFFSDKCLVVTITKSSRWNKNHSKHIFIVWHSLIHIFAYVLYQSKWNLTIRRMLQIFTLKNLI